ncbi:MAG: hypothetical protein AB7P03_00930 [Kofleriaceae bacterium]
MAASSAVLTVVMDLCGVTTGSAPVAIAMVAITAISGLLLVRVLQRARD